MPFKYMCLNSICQMHKHSRGLLVAFNTHSIITMHNQLKYVIYVNIARISFLIVIVIAFIIHVIVQNVVSLHKILS